MSRYRVFSPVLWNRFRRYVAVAIILLTVLASAQPASAQALNFENNFFVTGDYVVGGWNSKQVDPKRAGYAIGTISIPDTWQTSHITNPQANVPTQVPVGADIVAAFLYWSTVEKSQSEKAGQAAFFNGYPISGVVMGNQNAPVSWSAGGCAGASNGTTTMRVYRANVAPYLPVDSHGFTAPNTTYTVELADSNSGGNTAPFTLGATLVIVYRVLSPNFPLTAIVFYDGAFAPSNSSSTTKQVLQGFYQPGVNSGAPLLAKLTHIAGNGQSKKSEAVTLNSTPLQSLYGTRVPPFPGIYNNSWDNPTWNVSGALNAPPIDPSETTTVTPASNNSGCVSWGAMIFSTTVQDSDNDGLLDYWEQAPPNPVNPGGTVNPNLDPGYVDFGTGQFVPLPGACSGNHLNDAASCNGKTVETSKDIFVQLDYMCSNVSMNADHTFTCNGGSLYPDDVPNASGAVAMVASAFQANQHNINVHIVRGNAIPFTSCSDATSPTLCAYPDQPGLVAWKAGFASLKNQPLNYPDESSCETLTVGGVAGSGPACIRRFPFGRKDSWHYAIAANRLGGANWSFQDKSLQSLVVDSSGLTATLTTATPHKLAVYPSSPAGNDRITIANAISNPNLNGTFKVTADQGPYNFQIQFNPANPVPAGTYGLVADTNGTIPEPNLSVASGQGDTGSGFSDLGGQDTLISLGLWGADAQSAGVQAGTLMHELGHTIGLTHGGFYFDSAPASWVPTIEPNCKPNFQSIMSYLFQVDLLQDSDGNSWLDYSEEPLTAIDEIFGLKGSMGNTFYANTSWFSVTPPSGNPSPAKRFCNGAPLPNDNPPTPTAYRVDGFTNAVDLSGDFNFDNQTTGPITNTLTGFGGLRGHDDWNNIDLRQIGATGSLSSLPGGFSTGSGGGFSTGSGGGFSTGSGGGFSTGSGGGFSTGSGGGFSTGSGGGFSNGSGGGFSNGSGGVGNGEITHQVANSTVRPPRFLAITPHDTRTSHSAELNWKVPTFGTIASYNIYRGKDVDPPTLYYPTDPSQTLVTSTTYSDGNVESCHTYTYFVSSVLAQGGGESVGSNSVTYKVPCQIADPLSATGTLTNNAPSVQLTWGQAPATSGPVYGYNVYRDSGTTPLATVVGDSNTSYVDSPVVNNSTYTYYVTSILQDQTRCATGVYCRESTQKSVTITVVVKQTQTITFAPIQDRTWGDADFTVSATASSGLPVTFSTTTTAYCTVSGNTVHIVHASPSQGCSITASQAGNGDYYPAPDVLRSFTIKQATANISVTPYNIVYNGDPQTATGTATGVGPDAGKNVGALNLTGTTHTNAGTYNDTWTFSDPPTGSYGIGNYVSTNAQIADIIRKADPTIAVQAYSVPYDGLAHTATGTAKGVKNENLAGLNLSATVHTNPATYSSDSWTFTDITGNYNNVGPVTITDVIFKGDTTTTITSITPSTSVLGQSFTVKFTVAATVGGTPQGSVTVTADITGYSCNGALTSGSGSCLLTLPVLVSGKSVVGNRLITATYLGPDVNYNPGSKGRRNQQVVYNFTGFLSPLTTAGFPSNYSANLGKAIPIKWQLSTSTGSYITMSNIDLTKTSLVAVFNGKPVSGSCPVSSAGIVSLVLYPFASGYTGNSSFRYDSTNNQFIFNWDTSSNGSNGVGCYTITLQLDDGSAPKQTSLQLK